MPTTTSVVPNLQPEAKLLGLTISPAFDLRRQVELGFSFRNWETLQSNAGLTMKQMADLVDMTVKTLSRRKEQGRLTPAESDRLVRLSRILALAIELFEGDVAAARHWLAIPRTALGGAAPLELVRTEIGAREVERLIERLEDGTFS